MGAVAPPWAFIYSSKLVNFCCGGRRLMRTRPGSSSRLGALFRLRLREASCFGARGARAGWSALLRSVRPFPVLALPAAFCAGRAGRSVRSVRPPRAGRLALPGWALRRLWLFGAFCWVFSPLALPAYRSRLLLSAGEHPKLTLHLKPGEEALDAAGRLVEALTLKRKEISGETPAEGGIL